MRTLQQEDILRYSRHLPIIGVDGQLRLKNAKILCVGGGGLGCPALQYLSACGIGTLGVVDGDHIELSNLQRQILFGEKDIGRNKAQVIGERLNTLNTQTILDIYPEFLSEANANAIIAPYDVILDASDNFPTRYLLNNICRALKKPLISASILQFEAQLSVFNFNHGPCYQCLYPLPPTVGLSPNCSVSGVLGVLPGVAGSLQAMEAIKVILGYPGVLSGTLLTMNLLTMQFKSFEIMKQECNQHPSIPFHGHSLCESSLSDISEITAHDLAQLIANNPHAIQLLDIREAFERDICHIGGIHLPLSTLTQELAQSLLNQDQLIVVYCKSGMRSANVCRQLKSMGFQKVQNLNGGIISWINLIDSTLTSY